MTHTKSQIYNTIVGKSGFTRIKSIETVETILEIIKSTLTSDQNIMISGFGKIWLFNT